MASFEYAFLFIEINEGGYSEKPGEGGGETYIGISRNAHPGWAGWSYIDEWKSDNGTPTYGFLWPDLDLQVKEFHKKNSWDIMMGDHFASQAVATYFFDWFLDSGMTAVVQAKAALKIAEDKGSIGSDMIQAINEASSGFLSDLHQCRLQFYKDQAAENPFNRKFLKGRLVRINQLYSELNLIDN